MTSDQTRNLTLAAIAVILLFWALKATATISVPIVLALFVALVVAPVERHVREAMPEKLGWLGLVAAMASIVLALGAFIGAIWFAAGQVADSLDGVQQQIDSMMERGGGVTLFGYSLAELSARVSERALGELGSVAQTVLASSGVILSGFVIAFFMVALLLAERDRALKAAHNLLHGEDQQKLDDTVATAAHKMRIYLLVRLAMGIVTAILYTGWLWIFGLNLLFVWAILAVLLSFIPNIGSVISGSLPVLYALLTKDPSQVAIIAFGLFVIEQVIGNFVDPKIQGHQVTLSPVVVLLGILLWGWVWGIAGTLLATPISIAFVVAAAHWRWAEGIGLMLSNQTSVADLREVATGDADR